MGVYWQYKGVRALVTSITLAFLLVHAVTGSPNLDRVQVLLQLVGVLGPLNIGARACSRRRIVRYLSSPGQGGQPLTK